MNETSPFCLPKEILKKIVTASRDSKSLQQFMGCMSIWGGFGLWSWLCNLQSFLGGGLVTESCLTLETPQTGAHQAPLSMGFPRHEYWNGLSFPSSGDLPDPGIKPVSSALQVDSLSLSCQGSLLRITLSLRTEILERIIFYILTGSPMLHIYFY